MRMSEVFVDGERRHRSGQRVAFDSSGLGGICTAFIFVLKCSKGCCYRRSRLEVRHGGRGRARACNRGRLWRFGHICFKKVPHSGLDLRTAAVFVVVIFK